MNQRGPSGSVVITGASTGIGEACALRLWGIHVALVEPGDIDTPIWDKGSKTLRSVRDGLPQEAHDLYGPVFGLAEKVGRKGIPPGRVAEVVEHALYARKPKIRYLVGSDAKAV